MNWLSHYLPDLLVLHADALAAKKFFIQTFEESVKHMAVLGLEGAKGIPAWAIPPIHREFRLE